MRPDPIPSGLETDPEASAKRTAMMQQIAPVLHGQTGPATRNLTIIWDDERQAIIERLQALEARLLILEHNMRQPEPITPAPPAAR